MSPALRSKTDFLQIDEEDFIRSQVERDCPTSDFDYEGGFGEDDDLGDQTAENTIGCHSTFDVFDHIDEVANDNDQIIYDEIDAKESAA